MNLTRSTFLVAGLALFAGACGDDVTVTETPTPTTVALIRSVSVAPATATVNTGATISFTAAVNADPGLTPTVAWTASAGTITAAGAFTAPTTANPGVAVCATATAGTQSVRGCASVVVAAPAPVVPAQIQIQSITAGGFNTPVNPANVAGQIDVRLNVIPGNQRVDSIAFFVDGIRVYNQAFTAAQAAEMRSLGEQSTFPEIVVPIQTGCYNGSLLNCDALFAAGTAAGTPRWMNGSRAVQARLWSAGSATSASANQTLVFNNASGVHATYGAFDAQANAAATGLQYTRAALAINAIPVIFNPALSMATGATISASFGSAACDLSGTGARTAAMTAPASGSNAWTVTFSRTAAAAATNVTNYEFGGGGCVLANGERPTFTATDANGQSVVAAAAPLNNLGITPLRLDNRAPATAPTFVANPNSRANGWVNGTVALASNNTGATSNGWIVTQTAANDAGVGGWTAFFRIGTGGGTVANALAATATSTPTLPAPSNTNTGYCAVTSARDALGNETALPAAATVCTAPPAGASTAVAAQHLNFGVDIAAPTISYTAGAGLITANQRISGATIANSFQVTVNDTGLVGNSGMLPTSPVLMGISRRNAGTTPNSAGATTIFAPDGTTALAAGVTLSSTGVVAAAPLYTTGAGFSGTASAVAAHAYYTFNARAFDAAGNFTDIAPRTMVYDNTAPIAGVPSATAAAITAIGYSAVQNTSDDLDIQDFWFSGNYTGAPVIAPVVLDQAATAVNGFNAATFSNTAVNLTQTINLPLVLQANAAAGLTPIASLTSSARNQANLVGTSGAFALTITAPTAIPTGGATGMTAFSAVTLPGGVTGTVTGNTTAATAANPANVAFTVTTTGPTAVFNNPFSRVDFYMLNAAGTGYRLVGSTTAASLNDNGATRVFSYTATINGAAAYATLGGAGATFASQIVALGFNASGSVAMVSAALTGINVVF